MDMETEVEGNEMLLRVILILLSILPHKYTRGTIMSNAYMQPAYLLIVP